MFLEAIYSQIHQKDRGKRRKGNVLLLLNTQSKREELKYFAIVVCLFVLNYLMKKVFLFLFFMRIEVAKSFCVHTSTHPSYLLRET